jgi:hypothetical protein
MRRLVVELYGSELARSLERSPGFGRLRAFEVVHMLRYDQNEFAAICRVTPKDPEMSAEECFAGDPVTAELKVLEREEGSTLVLLKRRPRARRPGVPGPPLFGSELTKPGAGYLLGPLGFKEGRLRFAFLGTPSQLRDILGKARDRQLQYRVVSLKEAEFAGTPLDRLTERQQSVLRTAFRMGYYDVPRRVHSNRIAKSLDLSSATVVEHLRKAEHRLISILLESG